MFVRLVLAGACALSLSACVNSHVPYIKQPIKIVAFCQNLKLARPTAIASNMTSTDDTILRDRPTFADVRRAVSSGDGAIAYWHDQLLALPRVSVLMGETDGYARVEAVAVAPYVPEKIDRPIFMLLRDHGMPRWFAMNAYDLEDVCVEGKPQS